MSDQIPQYQGPRPSRWRWDFRYGLPAPIWIDYREAIGKFIADNGLKPIEQEHLGQDWAVPESMGKKLRPEWPRPVPRPFPGGLKIPHIHFKGDIYELDKAQWADFSRAAVNRIQERISRAGEVRFDELLDLSSALEGIR